MEKDVPHYIWRWCLLLLSLAAAEAPIYRFLWIGLLQLDLEIENHNRTKTKIFISKFIPTRTCDSTWYMLNKNPILLIDVISKSA